MSHVRSSALAVAVMTTALVAGPAAAQSGCRLVIESGADFWAMSYDPFRQDAAVKDFDIAVLNQGDAACSAVTRVELRAEEFGLTHSVTTQRIAYALVDERAGADVTPRAGQSARRLSARPLTLAPGERGLMRFSFQVAPSETPAAGVYSQNAYIVLESQDGQVLARRPLSLNMEVPSAAVMGLKGEFRRTGGVATLDLGELSEGSRSLRTTLYVLSTAGYSVSVSSANRGKLRQGSAEWYIPYDLALGDRDMQLAQGGRLDVVSRRARLDDYPLTIRIGSVVGSRAGEYKDTLTFTIAAI